ncbi:MAG: amidohydrolase [Spirochaetaceae bacterium]|nr:MAG: amidohydrolase [Spirochaetaceae bacterium]
MSSVQQLMKKYEQRLVQIRRELHMHPELSLKEFETTKRINAILAEVGVEVVDIGTETGTVGLIRGTNDGPTVALRGDIDALPIHEENDVEYRSTVDGVMHACGHDVHTTSLLGAAMILSDLRDTLRGNVKLIFQPAEEVNEGARQMIEHGVMDNPTVAAVFGLHTSPDFPAGQVAVKSGGLMAAVDTIRIEVRGVGGHGAIPHATVDPVVATAAMIMNLQSIVSRNTSALDSLVISIGTVNAGIANNVIPEVVKLTGTARSFEPQLRQKLPEIVQRVVDHSVAAYGATATLEYILHLPAVYNDASLTPLATSVVTEICGEGSAVEPTPTMGGEDFALYMQKAPGFFYWLGTGNKAKGYVHQWHNSRYNCDEASLPVGSGVLALSAIRALEDLAAR